MPEGERGWLDTINSIFRLSDGRVGAYVVTIDPVNHPHQSSAVVIFALVGDRWLIDEVHQDPSGTMGAPSTPVAGSGVPVAGVQTPVTSAGLVVTLSEAAIGNGAASLVVEITDASGKPVTDAQAELALEMREMAMGVEVVSAQSLGDGRYRAAAPVPMSGEWQVQVTIIRDGNAPAVFVFRITVE